MKSIPTKTSLLTFPLILEKANIQEGDTVVDLGCGRSLFFLHNLAQLVGKDGKVYALDILPEVINSLQRDINHYKLDRVIAQQANLEVKNELLEDGLFQAVFIINTLHQITDNLSAIKEARRLLHPAGKLVIIDWHPTYSPLGPRLEQRIESDHVKDMANLLNLTLLEEFNPGPYHYGLIFKK